MKPSIKDKGHAMPKKIGSITLYDLEEISKLFDVNLLTVQGYLRKGALKGQKMGKKWYVTEESLRDYFEGGTGKQTGRIGKKKGKA